MSGLEDYLDEFNEKLGGESDAEFVFKEDEYVDFDVDDTLEDIEKAGYSQLILEGLTGERSAMRAFNPTTEKFVNVGRCRIKKRFGPHAGEPCGKWAMRGTTVCVEHGGSTPSVRKAAQRRVQKAKDDLAANINLGVQRHIHLIKSNDTPHNVHLQAVKLMYDVAGMNAPEEEVVEEVKESPLMKLDGIMSEMRNRITTENRQELEVLEEELIDEGEIVEDGEVVERDQE